MRAILVWPNRAAKAKSNTKPMDYFWVECTAEEAEEKIVPRLSEERKRSVPDVSDLRDVVVEIIDFAEWENSETMKCEN